MKILVHVFVLEGILGSLVRRGDAGVEVLKMLGEADAHFKGIHVGISATQSVTTIWNWTLVFAGCVDFIVQRETNGVAESEDACEAQPDREARLRKIWW